MLKRISSLLFEDDIEDDEIEDDKTGQAVSKERIYLAYPHDNYSLASKFKAEFESMGFQTWLDKGVETGEERIKAIKLHIEESTVIVCLFSTNIHKAPSCQEEMTLIQECQSKKTVILIYVNERNTLDQQWIESFKSKIKHLIQLDYLSVNKSVAETTDYLIAYRRKIKELAKAKKNDVVRFGSYPQDKDGKEKTPVEWIVLDRKEDKLLLLSKFALINKKYHETGIRVTWETCKLRKWLNNEFYETAFNAKEKKSIVEAMVKADANPRYDTDPGKDTLDKVFVLSWKEANHYFGKAKNAQCVPTDYAKVKGLFVDGDNHCYWWLRTPGNDQSSVVIVGEDGVRYLGGSGVFYGHNCVRPSMWVDGSSVDAEIGRTIVFGRYEQDVNRSGRKKSIEWLILDEKDGNYLLISKYGLDCKKYEDVEVSVTWETCTLREWLNNEFYGELLSEWEKALAVKGKVQAEDNPRYGTDAGNETEDSIYLLNIREAQDYFENDEARKCEPTEFAKERGIYINKKSKKCVWWLCSPGFDGYSAAIVYDGGSDDAYGFNVDYVDVGVRPALWLNLESEIL